MSENILIQFNRYNSLERHKSFIRFFSNSLFVSFIIIFIFFVLLVSSYLFDIINISNVSSSKKGFLGAYVVVSGSMQPTIDINDAIIIRRVKSNNIKVGDVITFKSNDVNHPNITITHRVVGIVNKEDGLYFRTKGDNNKVTDSSLVSSKCVYGKVDLIIPKLGYFQKFIVTPTGFCLFILLTIFIILFGDFINRYFYKLFMFNNKKYGYVDVDFEII